MTQATENTKQNRTGRSSLAAFERSARSQAPSGAALSGSLFVALVAAAVLLAAGWVRVVDPVSGAGSAALGWASLGAQGALLAVIARLWCRVSGTRRSGRAPAAVGPYTLGPKLGEGGMGVVYEARHALLPRRAAIKLLKRGRADADRLKRFEREVQLTSVLTHPNTVSIYDYGRSADGTFYYAMEYLNGLDLQTLVERHGPQDPARVASLLAQICGALGEAHGIGLIHRDVKPANLMLCERGGVQDVVKVVDFGLIQDLERRDDEVTRSEVRAIVGTPLYLSPEALTAPEAMDGRSDLYAVGAVGYFLLTGAPPFSGEGLLEVCAHHLHTAPVAPSRRTATPIPLELDALILSCLEKSPDRRPESAAALRAALLPLAAEWSSERADRWWAERAEAPVANADEKNFSPCRSRGASSVVTVEPGLALGA